MEKEKEENKIINEVNSSFKSNTLSHSNLSLNSCAHMQDLVLANNNKNEKLTDVTETDYIQNGDEELEEETRDEIDEDWFLKLINTKDTPRNSLSEAIIDGGSNHAEIPLLDDEDADYKKAVTTLKIGLKKIWRRGSATITQEDPIYKVAYLGNVLTGWAKGEGCIEKPLNTLWKNYNGSSKPDIPMKISVTQSGLKAVTKAHGLIEYWSHRITYCTVPPSLPRIFCWIYRHEGKKLKQELRCHAVLCSKSSVATCMANTLKLRLTQALLDFKKDKLLRQKARLSFANSIFDNPSLPRRKILLSTGYHNYKPPLEKSKSAPKLMSIEEDFEEEESTPKVKRQATGEEVVDKKHVRCGTEEDRSKRNYFEEKCENYKLSNLNFVKKICSSIENLVESTSFYGKKFLNERKSSKDLYFGGRIPEETLGLKQSSKEKNKEKIVKAKTFKIGKSFDNFNKAEGTECKIVQGISCTNLSNKAKDSNEERNQDSADKSKLLEKVSNKCNSLPPLSTLPLSNKKDANFDYLSIDESRIEELQKLLKSCNCNLLSEGNETVHHEVCSLETKEKNKVSLDGQEFDNGPQTPQDSRLNLKVHEQTVPLYRIIGSTPLEQGPLQSNCLHI